jgi:hypothetical protein
MAEKFIQVNKTHYRIAGPISPEDIVDEPLITWLKNQMREELLLEVPQDVEGELIVEVQHRFDRNDYMLLMEWRPLKHIEIKEKN